MKQKDFVFNLCLLIFLNLLVKPFWILGIDIGVQNRVGADVYGLYFSILSFTMLFNMVLDMGTTNYNNRNIARHSERLDEQFSGFVVLRLLLGLVYFAVVFVAALVIGYSGVHLRLLFWIALNQFLNAFLLYVRSNISALMMFKTDSVISVLDKLLMIIFCGVLLWGNITGNQFRIEWFIWCQTVAYLLTIMVASIVVLRKAPFKKLNFSFAFAWQIIKKSFPYALITLLMVSYYRIDSVMIERILPEDIAVTQSGIYASAFRIMDALAIVAYLFSVILLPLFSKMLKNREDVVPIVQTSFALMAVFSISAAAILFAYRTPVMQTLYTDHVSESIQVFGLIIFGLIPLSFTYIFGTLLTANGNLKEMNIISAMGIVVNVAVNLVLIPRMGARGSAIASLSTQIFISLMQFVFAVKILDIPLREIPIARTVVFFVLVISISYILSYLMSSHVVVSILLSGVAAIVVGFLTKLIDLRTAVDMVKGGGN